jgi:hypothetical protein
VGGFFELVCVLNLVLVVLVVVVMLEYILFFVLARCMFRLRQGFDLRPVDHVHADSTR